MSIQDSCIEGAHDTYQSLVNKCPFEEGFRDILPPAQQLWACLVASHKDVFAVGYFIGLNLLLDRGDEVIEFSILLSTTQGSYLH